MGKSVMDISMKTADKYKVMIVEDSNVARVLLKKLPVWAPRTCFEVVCEAEDGEEAIGKLAFMDIDIVITDIEMPRTGGLELLAHIREHHGHIDVILISSYRDFELARKGIVYGAFDYLVKPVTKTAMLDTFKRLEKIKVNHPSNILIEKGIDDYAMDLSESFKRDTSVEQTMVDGLFDSIVRNLGIVGNRKVVMIVAARAVMRTCFTEYPALGLDSMATMMVGMSWHDGVPSMGEDEFKEFFKLFVDEIGQLYGELILPMSGNEMVRSVVAYVLNAFNQPQTVNGVAQGLYVNRSYLSQAFKKQTGITLSAYLMKVKMICAMTLLMEREQSVAEVANRLGYEDKEHFSNLFRAYAGHLPRAFQRRMCEFTV